MSDYEVTLTVRSSLHPDQLLPVIEGAVADKTGEAANVEIDDWSEA